MTSVGARRARARVYFFALLVVVSRLIALGRSASAGVIDANPSNYRELLNTLVPGDELRLKPGRYTRLTLRNIRGTAKRWITISGPPGGGTPAVIESESCCNTVQLYGSAFVVVRGLVIDVGGLSVDAINAKDGVSHHIRIEDNLLTNFPDDQLIVGINTKSTAWDWEIRGNRIIAPGTGIYLGGSSGDSPFINGIIENNLILNPTGYCMQVKQQNNYALVEGMPVGPNRTIIRNNVFIKNERPSPSGDRPNLLVSGFPESGPGSMDHYEIYGNFIFYNSRESLFQGAGRIHLHDNIFVGAGASSTAILLTPHQGKELQVAHVYNNTIYGVARGIRVTSGASESSRVVGNLVFAAAPIGGAIEDSRDNIVETLGDAGMYVNSPSATIGMMDFYPREGMVSGDPLDLSEFADDVDYDMDFNGFDKGEFLHRGAYAGQGSNPGWTLAAEIKPPGGGTPPGGFDAGATSHDGGSDGGAESNGGGCSTVLAEGRRNGAWILMALLFCDIRRRKSAKKVLPLTRRMRGEGA